MIVLKGVGRKFGDVVALHPITLTIESSRTTALIGPSGCGKSTILRLILGLLEPTSGTLEVESQPVSPSSVRNLRRRMGYVVQDGGFFPI
jgi:osmoprotectant transport system ATP-binding protein